MKHGNPNNTTHYVFILMVLLLLIGALYILVPNKTATAPDEKILTTFSQIFCTLAGYLVGQNTSKDA